MITGYVLHYLRINPGLVLGGLLMPINISIGLLIGGLISFLSHHKERWFPLWSGIFAGSSIWMLLTALFW
jgi:hypothetical protein